jgi:uncharacterized MnhB-related membrane protein
MDCLLIEAMTECDVAGIEALVDAAVVVVVVVLAVDVDVNESEMMRSCWPSSYSGTLDSAN